MMPFSAADAALGYVYQIRYALENALQRLREDVAFEAYIETLDDVVFTHANSADELLQLKHHRRGSANLSDGASTDLWKSLRVWLVGRASGDIATDAALFLVTTTSVGDGSAASFLGRYGRDIDRAAQRLSATASTSRATGNQEAYRLFQALAPADRTTLLDSVTIVSGAPSITDVDTKLRQHSALCVRDKHIDAFLSRVEGWWLRAAVVQMKSASERTVATSVRPIRSEELRAEIDDTRETFTRDALPINDEIIELNVAPEGYENHVFTHQARLAGVRGRRLQNAIRDYYRAYEQRARWMREELLHVGELGRYERRLREEWEMEFDRMVDELGDDAEDARDEAAKKLYAWAETLVMPIRPQVTEQSLSRGSLHILADGLKVGWHPDFLARLEHLLALPQAS